MMVVPVDPQVDKAEHVIEKGRQHAAQRLEAVSVWNPQFENHDRDHNGDHGVAERLEPISGHLDCTLYNARAPLRPSGVNAKVEATKSCNSRGAADSSITT